MMSSSTIAISPKNESDDVPEEDMEDPDDDDDDDVAEEDIEDPDEDDVAEEDIEDPDEDDVAEVDPEVDPEVAVEDPEEIEEPEEEEEDPEEIEEEDVEEEELDDEEVEVEDEKNEVDDDMASSVQSSTKRQRDWLEMDSREETILELPGWTPPRYERQLSHLYLTKYELIHLIGMRTQQLARGAPTTLTNHSFSMVSIQSAEQIAIEELRKRKCPFLLKRYFPNGHVEEISVNQCGFDDVFA